LIKLFVKCGRTAPASRRYHATFIASDVRGSSGSTHRGLRPSGEPVPRPKRHRTKTGQPNKLNEWKSTSTVSIVV